MRTGPTIVPFELKLTYLGILVTLITAVAFLGQLVPILQLEFDHATLRTVIQLSVYMLFAGILIYGSTIYQFTRIGYLRRLAVHRRATDDELRVIYGTTALPLTVLIPSYKEEERVIRQALLSAALQEYPNREVVLLIDDPANPKNQIDFDALRRARQLPQEIQVLLRNAQRGVDRALPCSLVRKSHGQLDLKEECLRLSVRYQAVAQWFETHAKQQPLNDHTDVLFSEKVLQARALHHRDHARRALSARAAH